jgi:flotillin
LREIVQACGGSQAAFQMLMLEHLDHLAETSAKAIANIKFDKIVVWDGANGQGDGKAGSNTSRFLQSLASALPPTLQMMRDVGGVEMPEFLGRLATPASPQDGVAPPSPEPDTAPAPKEPPPRSKPQQ